MSENENEAIIFSAAKTDNYSKIVSQLPVRENKIECPSNPYEETPSVNNSLYFMDGIRSVDFVLVWKDELQDQLHLKESRKKKRHIFEENLVRDGLELERETIENEIHFIKVGRIIAVC